MPPEIVVAIISLIGTTVGSCLGIVASNSLMRYRIDQLEQKVNKHNNLIERMVIVEQSVKSAWHRIDEMAEKERE